MDNRSSTHKHAEEQLRNTITAMERKDYIDNSIAVIGILIAAIISSGGNYGKQSQIRQVLRRQKSEVRGQMVHGKARDAEGQKQTAAGLRKKAEDHLRKSRVKSEVFGDTQKLIHELQVHQIELEMQNDELRKAQQELQASRDNYFDFYNFSPVGYFTFDEKGQMLDLNLTSAALLGKAKQELISRNFKSFIPSDFRPAFGAFCKKVLEADTRQTLELRLDASSRVVLMEGISVPDADGNGKSIRTVMVDITERKAMEEKLEQGKKKLEKAVKDTLHVLMSTIEQRMAQAPKNRQREVVLACAIAGEMGLSAEFIESISVAGSILDLGYISVPGELLSKPLKLWVVMYYQLSHCIKGNINFRGIKKCLEPTGKVFSA